MIGRKSITLRLTLLFATASTVVLIALGVWIDLAIERHFIELDSDELEGKMNLVGGLLSSAHSPDDLAGLPRRMDEALVGHPGLSLSLVRADGSTLYASPGTEFPEGLRRTSDAATTSDNKAKLLSWVQAGHEFRGLVANVPTGMANEPPLTVAIGLDIGRHREFHTTFDNTLWVMITAGILLTGALGWVAAQRGLAPIRDMARISQGVSATRLSARLSLETLPTELVGLGVAYNDMLTRLEDSFRRLSDCSSDLAHELRTPISNLMTQTQVALSRSRSASEYREVLYSNLEELDRLARTIADMLFLAKADNGLIVPHGETIDLRAEVGELFEFYDALAEHQGIRLEFTGEGTVSGDRLMIRRAISNLLSNALQHTSHGETVRVRIGETESGEFCLSVENPGDEIPAEHLGRLFDRFYQVDPARQSTDGAGLGLAITKSIMTVHRGSVHVVSANGAMIFALQFPKA